MTESRTEGPHSFEPQVLAGRYELLGLVGTGGMGSVYRARDRELDEIVALKMLRKELLDTPGMLARFRQEVKLARKVTHKNVARTFDIGEHAGDKFLTMELVEGESLANVLHRQKKLGLVRVVECVEAICAALSAAHAAGIVHRDLKPDNVLIAKDGRVVVTDFGIARAITSDVRHTVGAPIGTPTYMAPEQLDGSAAIDARADLYALGAMTYELLTGQPAWTGDSAYAIAAQRLVAPPPDPRAQEPRIPDAVAQLVMRCMARKPEDRYASAAEVASALGSLTLPVGFAEPAQVSVRSAPPAASSSPSSTHASQKSVAVLPLRNAGSAEDEYLADGLTEDLIDTLSMIRHLRVRSRGAVMRYKGQDRDPREIGGELEVQVVADGSVRRFGDQLRISVKLVSVADGFQLWAQRYDRPASDVLVVGDEAARAIAEALTVDWRAPVRHAPTDPVALDLYLRARHEAGKRWRPATARSLELFEQALARAPDDPTILGQYAMALSRSYGNDEEGNAHLDRAREIAARAVANGPQIGVPRLALASLHVVVGEPVSAARELRKALLLSPTLPEAHDLYGRMLLEVGQRDKAMEHLETALKLDPSLVFVKYDVARAQALAGDFESSRGLYASPPEDPETRAQHWLSRMRLVLWQRDVETAKRCLEDPEIGPATRAVFEVVVTRTMSAEQRALFVLRAPARAKRRRAFNLQLEAETCAHCGDIEGALDALNRAAECALFDLDWMDRCPLFDSLRAEPRFPALRDRVARLAADVAAALAGSTG